MFWWQSPEHERRGDWLRSRVGTSFAASPLSNFLAGGEVKNMAALPPNTARLRIPPAVKARSNTARYPGKMGLGRGGGGGGG